VAAVKTPEQLLEGVVDAVELKPETVTTTVTKFMRIVSITRTPEQRIANIDLMLARGTVALEIDEATALAIAKVFA
jgi:hypothetical protein